MNTGNEHIGEDEMRPEYDLRGGVWKQRFRSGQFSPGTAWPARPASGRIFDFGQTDRAVPARAGTWASVGACP